MKNRDLIKMLLEHDMDMEVMVRDTNTYAYPILARVEEAYVRRTINQNEYYRVTSTESDNKVILL